jgi:hypothetical protein
LWLHGTIANVPIIIYIHSTDKTPAIKKTTHPTTRSHLSFIYVFDHQSPSSSFTLAPHPPHELHKRPSVHCFLFAIIISLKPNALNVYKTMVSYCFMYLWLLHSSSQSHILFSGWFVQQQQFMAGYNSHE